MSSADCVGGITAVKQVAMLRQSLLEITRESRPEDNRLIILAFAELMLRRGVGELAGEERHRKPSATTDEYQSLEVILNILSYVCQHCCMSRIHEMVDATASNEDQNASTDLKTTSAGRRIRPATKSVELLDALGEKPRPQGFLRDLAWRA
jgi:hypothetical protein